MQASPASTPPQFLSGLTPDQEKVVAQAAQRRTCRADSVIVRGGDPAENLFLLLNGRAKYYRVTKKGEEVLLWWLAPGDTFGIGTLVLRSNNYFGTAQAVEDCELLMWGRDQIRGFAEKYKILYENALQILLYYLAAYADRLVELTTGTAEERLAHALLQLGRRIGHVRSNAIELTILNEHLAQMANVSNFTASRQLKDWERQGLIRKSRGKVVILSPEGLLID